MEPTPGAVPGSQPRVTTEGQDQNFGELSEINVKSNQSLSRGAQDVLTSPYSPQKEVKHHLKDLKNNF